MLLIPEQVYKLREKEKKLQGECGNYRELLKDSTTDLKIDLESRSIGMINNVYNDFYEKHKKLKLIENALSSNTYHVNKNYDFITIGTKFDLLFDDSDDIESYQMVDELTTVDSIFEMIAANSMLGKSILGKRDGERFEYKIEGKKVSGRVLRIEKDINKYMHFIKEKAFAFRKSKTYQETIKFLRHCPELKEEYESYKTITKSQFDLLTIEKEALKRLPKKNSTTNRIAYINSL